MILNKYNNKIKFKLTRILTKNKKEYNNNNIFVL